MVCSFITRAVKEANCHKYYFLFLCLGCTSLNFSSKTQRSFCNQAENTVPFQGPNASQGTFTLPTCPLSSPRNSPKHVSSPADSPRKSQGNTMKFSIPGFLKALKDCLSLAHRNSFSVKSQETIQVGRLAT